MYQFSRAIYRELAGDILEPDTPWSDCHPHERVLKSCEAAIERLATDRHYFARPARTLFNDIRIFFPMSKQHCVWHVVRNYLELADEFFARQPLRGFDVNGNPLECRATTREVERFAHGMTVATNALLEGRGARTVLVATEGFTDVVELRRQARAQLYRLCAAHPAPLVPPELRLPAPERMGPDGPLRALEAPDAARVCDAVAAAEPEAVAVALLHSYRHPAHERLLAAELARRLPGTHVSLSHEV